MLIEEYSEHFELLVVEVKIANKLKKVMKVQNMLFNNQNREKMNGFITKTNIG